ncbi:ribose-phosphate diphosphokinase [Clostridium cellulovorans]|uniref:Ribose-phosphate pyrophosphokinase n=1 Tax=Clostridium cellulovorans (strain ATCC 35296 / DSM 3052 / OCM 3 / 743B) TaxID=573061 RepID=D9SKQ5_CLOC7|nr:ribose-phosphate pyrophosphokinase [Clostridium cellulovorans]ADL53477.1 ribose-phosphate pyrophosphokinase [Clostridium cellulovorans 743B]
MISHGKNIKIFTANAHPMLAEDIADILELKVGESKVGKFSNGETSVDINETVRGAHIFVVQPIFDEVNDRLMELLIMIDAFKRASAGVVTAVIPHYAYARQDRKSKARQPITAKLIADILTAAGADRVLTMDLHAAQIQGFFNIPVDNLAGVPILAEYFQNLDIDTEDLIAVSPDIGGVKRTRNFADILQIPIAIVDKRRPRPNVSEVMNLIGDVEGKVAVLIDDMIDTAGSITNAAEALLKRGAREVYACCTHPLLSGPAIERIEKSPIKQLVVLDTIPLSEEKKIEKIKVLPVAPVFAEAIRRIYEDLPVSKIFEK